MWVAPIVGEGGIDKRLVGVIGKIGTGWSPVIVLPKLTRLLAMAADGGSEDIINTLMIMCDSARVPGPACKATMTLDSYFFSTILNHRQSARIKS